MTKAPVKAKAPAKTNVPAKQPDVWDDVAQIAGASTDDFKKAVLATTGFDAKSQEHLLGFLAICSAHGLNPLTKEIFAFKAGGRVMPIVSIDGWMKMVNEHPQFDGMTTEYEFNGDQLIACTATMHRKDREHPTSVTELLSECRRNTDVWKQWPSRMLRHKAVIQCARYAFSFADIYEADEVERIIGQEGDIWADVEMGGMKDITPEAPPPPPDVMGEERPPDVQEAPPSDETPPIEEEPEGPPADVEPWDEPEAEAPEEESISDGRFDVAAFSADIISCSTVDDLNEMMAAYKDFLVPELAEPQDLERARTLYKEQVIKIRKAA